MTLPTFLELVCWACIAAACVIAAQGVLRSSMMALFSGACLGCYSMTGLNYVKLFDPGRPPLSLLERDWGASSAIFGGAACVGMLVVLRRRDQLDREESGGIRLTSPKDRHVAEVKRLNEWSDVKLIKPLSGVALLAVASVAVVNISLIRSGDLAPSANFLVDYGHYVGVAVYEIIFAVWILLPVGNLGYTALKVHGAGPFRWFVVAGGAIGVAWGLWKILGVLAIFVLDARVDDESPVSVALGLATLGTAVFGIAASGLWASINFQGGSSAYEEDIGGEDDDLRGRLAGNK